MGTEIERKFLVSDESWRADAHGAPCRQGYLTVGPPVAVRVRLMGGQATLNVKKSTINVVRDEFEYAIPLEDAEAMLNGLCEGWIVEKTRYKVEFSGRVWEIDVFDGANQGLVVAEIELRDETEPFPSPPWLGEEVSGDPRYLNSNLSRNPYTRWTK
jgi:CYTH domain-containing protein